MGVTQAYAASVLRNTSGPVKFLIGREKDPENSEVAHLIRQSLAADKEREERLILCLLYYSYTSRPAAASSSHLLTMWVNSKELYKMSDILRGAVCVG